MLKKGFTLIELLIVVAIIAILAAIAVPNFLEAQVRAKVARVKTDLRTYATAIESYAVDHNRVPREQNSTWYPGDEIEALPGSDGKINKAPVAVAGILPNLLSTPIAYITTARVKDIFQDKNLNPPLDEQYYTYNDLITRSKPGLSGTGSEFWQSAPTFYGSWRMLSVGPDRTFGHAGHPAPNAQLAYDPTNGTVSQGNIFRSQKLTDSAQPIAGQLYPPGNVALLGGS